MNEWHRQHTDHSLTIMEAVILCGIQATGKSAFCKERLHSTHVRINLDMLKTRHRESVMLRACIDAKQPFVIDNTNPTRSEREHYIREAKAAGFRVVGYYFESRVSDALARNESRSGDAKIETKGIKSTAARLELPARAEGFDDLYYVKLTSDGFDIQEWRDEV
jgi:predicted kinase